MSESTVSFIVHTYLRVLCIDQHIHIYIYMDVCKHVCTYVCMQDRF